jgi:tetratricopeptide (TPR) repeat protein
LAGANRLAQLAPAAGHIVHMPAHIYIRTGDYQAAVQTNQKAALADQAYIKAGGGEGIYSMMYYSHNLHFIAMAAAMNGNYLESRRGAQLLAANVGPHVKEMPPLGGFMTVPLAVEVRFHKWNEILKALQPDPAMQTATVFWHFARGLAFASTGKLDEAEAEHKMVAEAEEKTPPDAIFQMPINNKTKDILKIAENVLGAKISLAKNDMDATVNQLRAAVATQDLLKYDEPQDWFYPVRESLGAVLLKIGDNAGAEEVFRADLERNPRNPRSLFGLEQALKAQEKTYDAGFVRKQFDANWKGTTRPTVDDLV